MARKNELLSGIHQSEVDEDKDQILQAKKAPLYKTMEEIARLSKDKESH